MSVQTITGADTLIVKFDREYWRSYYQYYGGLPYWSNAYAYPDYHTWYDR